MVDLTGIEPANLCNANAALSQLSYRPSSKQSFLLRFFFEKKLRLKASLLLSPHLRTSVRGPLLGAPVYYKRFEEKSQEKKSPSDAFRRAFPVRSFSGRLR